MERGQSCSRTWDDYHSRIVDGERDAFVERGAERARDNFVNCRQGNAVRIPSRDHVLQPHHVPLCRFSLSLSLSLPPRFLRFSLPREEFVLDQPVRWRMPIKRAFFRRVQHSAKKNADVCKYYEREREREREK